MLRAALLSLLLATPSAARPLLGIDVTEAQGEGFAAALSAAAAIGAEASSLTIYWDETEGDGASAPALDRLAMANRYLPPAGLRWTLTLSVVDTVADRRPEELRGLAWDDPELARRFAAHAEAVLSRLPALDLIAVAVGNETDGLLRTDEEARAYAAFLAAAREAVGRVRPGVPVGTKLGFGGLTANPDRFAPILAASDVAMVTYYPLAADFSVRPPADAADDLDRLLAVVGARPLWIMEAGYPSGGCGASEAAQADFARALLAAVDAREDRIGLVSWTFLTDLAPATVDDLEAYYGLSTPCFLSYLATLGLRDGTGRAKPALAAVDAWR